MVMVTAWRRSVAESEMAANAALGRVEADLALQRRRIDRMMRRVLAGLGLVALLQLALLVAWLFG